MHRKFQEIFNSTLSKQHPPDNGGGVVDDGGGDDVNDDDGGGDDVNDDDAYSCSAPIRFASGTNQLISELGFGSEHRLESV